MFRESTIGLLLVCLACAEALACRGESLERTIIFDEVPTSVDAAIVVPSLVG
jgi:hypothetical protein